MPGPKPYTYAEGGGKLPPYGEDFSQRIVGVHWRKPSIGIGISTCRFAVCGYDGNEGVIDPVFFGVGAYSNDGMAWTPFRALENGSMASCFHMRDPHNIGATMLVVGGCTNQDDPPQSIASLRTVFGSGPSAGGGVSEGRNVAKYGSIGYDKYTDLMYAVENSGPNASSKILHVFQLGVLQEIPPQSDLPINPQGSSIFWAGDTYDGIGPVYSCDAPMTFRDRQGAVHFLSYDFSGANAKLLLDGNDISPTVRGVRSAAGGMNDAGVTIIIATGYRLIGTDDHAAAWWSIEGNGWNEIGGIWTGAPELQTPAMASAVPV